MPPPFREEVDQSTSEPGFWNPTASVLAQLLQSCPILWDSIDHSQPGSPSMGFSRQEYWCGLLGPLPGDLPDPGIEPVSPALAGGFFTTKPCGKWFEPKSPLNSSYLSMVFPVVMYGCESWTVKKAERQRIDAFELWC